jgi:hypothetical protein
VGIHGQRFDLADGTERIQHFPNLGVGQAMLARGDRGEFVEYLDADDAATSDDVLGPVGLDGIRRKQIQKDVGVEKGFFSSPSLFSPAHGLPAGRT